MKKSKIQGALRKPLLLGVLATALPAAAYGQLVINEIQVCNTDQYVDASNNYGSWVELYNPTDASISLNGLYISNDPENLKLYKLTTINGSVPSKRYKVLGFDHHSSQGNYGTTANRQVKFKLDVEGGTLWLSNEEGQIISQVTYPAGIARCSYARTVDAGEAWGVTGTPTPEQTNNGSSFALRRLEAPVVSTDGGILATGARVDFNVRIPQGAILRYTTDGSAPTLTKGTTSTTGRFTVEATSVYRFALFQDGMLPSPVVTRSFIFKNHAYYLPILSVVTAPANLYDSKLGVYCSGTNGITGNGQNTAKNWNMDWERPVNMELFVPEQNTEGETSFQAFINQEVNFEICGGWSRAYGGGTTDGKRWEMKSSFRLKSAKEYEMKHELDYPIFPHKPYNKYRVWQVRNGGNDTKARIIDPALSQIVIRSGFYVDAQDARPSHVFFNGQYVGMFNIREANNRHYGYSNYGIDTDEMDQFELALGFKQKVGDNVAWKELVSLSAQLASQQTEELYEQICERLDVDEYTNFMAVCCYLGSNDWITNTNNVKAFRSRLDNGRFHFVMMDQDAAFSMDNMVGSILNTNYSADVDDLFRNLMKYNPFRKRFVDAFCLVNGSVFEPKRCEAIINEMYNERQTALGFEGNSCNKNLVSTIRNNHNGRRMTNLKNTLGLPNPYRLNLSSNVDEAQLMLNGQMVPTGRFDGMLYDVNGEGLQLTALAPAGYRFLGWEQTEGDEEENMERTSILPYGALWEYYDQGPVEGTEWRTEGFEASRNGWKSGQAPFGYASSGKPMASMIKTKWSYGSNSSNKRPTYYLRRRFYLDQKPQKGELFRLNYKVDDGFRFYINGKDVDGYRCPKDCSFNYLTGDYTQDNPDVGWFAIEASDLHEGWNVLAVEVHNCSATSSDIFWDGELQKLTPMGEAESAYLTREPSFNLVDELEESVPYILRACFEPLDEGRPALEAGATPVRINEVSAGNDIHINDYGKKNDWVELYNTTDRPIDVEGMFLSDKEKKPQKWQITGRREDGTTVPTVIAPHGTLIVWCDQLVTRSQLHAPFKLDNADGACVSIQAEDGTWSDRMYYMEQPRWHSYGRFPDGGSRTMLMVQPTIDQANRIGTTDLQAWQQAAPLNEDISITLALNEGWNWVSHNLQEGVHNSRFTAAADRLAGQQASYWRNEAGDWAGELEFLASATGYKVHATHDAEVTLRGRLFETSVKAVTVNEGWNWLGFPLYNATTLDVALAHFRPSEGDVLVGQDAFATYEDGEWEGSLSTLRPGQAYLLLAHESGQFLWHSLSPATASHRRYVRQAANELSPWPFNLHAYPSAMPVVVQLRTLDGEEADEAFLSGCQLGVFAGNECRGVAQRVGNLFFVNAHGEGGEQLTFRLLTDEGTLMQARKTLAMEAESVVGTRQQPYVLDFSDPVIDDRIMAAQPASRMVSQQYYNLAGQRLDHPVGICIRKQHFADGHVVVTKLNCR